MFLLIPVGVEGHEVRMPVVCIGIVAACVLMFFGTWVLPENSDGIDRGALRELVKEWETHPYLELPDAFTGKKEEIDRYRAKWLETHAAPSPEDRAAEQKAFSERLDRVFAAVDNSAMRRFALVPQRGYFQLGLFTHMFIHFGWMHLLGNLLFFYMCGPLLEDTWGRKLFALFYLLGGLVAGTAHFLIDRHSTVPMGGASGAIAACMGAFAVRFATRKVAMGYFILLGFRPVRGIWHWPAWVCGFLWFGSEVLTAVLSGGKAGGVAVMAHVGGFAFGAGIAFGMKAIGLEKSFIPFSEQDLGPLQVSLLKEVEEARAFVQAGNRGAARVKYEAALKKAPDDADAAVGLVMLDFSEDARPAGLSRLERLLGKLLRTKEEPRAISALWEVWPALKADELKPALAFALAKASEEVGEQGQGLSEPLFLRAGAAPGLMGAKALLRAAELQQLAGDSRAAAGTIGLLLKRTDAGPELTERARQLKAKIPDVGLSSSGLELDLPPLPRPPPKVVPCVLLAVTDQGLTLQSRTGDENRLPFPQVLGVAAGLIPLAVAGAPPHGVLLVDLILSWGDAGSAAISVRLDSDTTAMSKLFPGGSAAEVYGRFLSHLLEASGATALPDAASLKTGKFPRYPSTEERDAAIFPLA